MRKIADVKNALAVLQWDQETYMPRKGATRRGEQMATLSELAHQLFADESLENLLMELSGTDGLSEVQARNIALTREDFEKNKRYSPELVRALAETTNKCYHAWIESRRQNDFRFFETELDALVRLKKEEAQVLGFKQHPYDALLNEFEKGATVNWLDELFNDLRTPLRSLLSSLMEMPQPKTEFLRQHFGKDAQWRFGLELLKQMGFDFEAGRQDISEHPFTTSFSTGDVRVTTRIDENDFSSMTWSCLHEGGHALYEQGLPGDQYGLPSGEFCSLGIHESQSRLWENCIGRNKAFIEHNINLVRKSFPQLNTVSPQHLFAAVNVVKPSLIRTESDELTYHFHVMIRYELEKRLIEGSLATKDIPQFWNSSYKQLLGVDVPDDKSGCLQDIHWSHGSLGYFPTYSLGSLYAAQFYASMNKTHSGIAGEIANGNYTTIQRWLHRHVYQYGRSFTSNELCNKATGEPLQMEYFVQYLTAKYQDVYQF